MAPIRFAFGLHLHQPVGNFDHVFEEHVRDVYLPFLSQAADAEFFPLMLHISGPLLAWLQQRDPRYLDRVGSLVSDGKIELLLAGYDEPVLAALPREDRREQIEWMRESLKRQFGVEPSGLWLTERVWEPDLAADLADAGVRYALVDDRHFLTAGFTRRQLHGHYRTESDGKYVSLFPIDERLRYLIPFRPPAETATYLRELRAHGHRLATLADDGEKFGGWPGTREWVYQKGWLRSFFETMRGMVEAEEVSLCSFSQALREIPSSGLAYLPTASYREMEGWALPADAAVRLARLEHDLGPERIAGPDGAMIRGTHWRNFLVKYPESNRMHKMMLAVSRLCRTANGSTETRRTVGRAQCNDAYWHGVFGGLYLPHLRHAIWHNLARAEQDLRAGQRLDWQVLDIDGDGRDEIWVHSAAFSAVVAPHRGGALEVYTLFDRGLNLADVLTRRREAYHATAGAGPAHESHDGTPSIHELEGATPPEIPPFDLEDRALFVDRVLRPEVELDAYRQGDYTAFWSGALQEMTPTCSARAKGMLI
ncbi:MAG: alpha-amylase/4-alpha-glucanotransferase domain-containing protein, partial [Gemmatimonadales bacterium]